MRVTCFGSYISAIKIDSQKSQFGEVDWRKIPVGDLELSEVELPSNLKSQIISYMKKMNIVFGCFDFIVTHKDEIIFLEVNEQGQFLWIEDLLPETNYLDIFCNFVLNRNFNFDWKPHSNMIKSSSYDSQAKKIIKNNITNHIHQNQIERIIKQ